MEYIKNILNNSKGLFTSQIAAFVILIVQVGLVTKSLGVENYGKLSVMLISVSLIFRLFISKNSDVTLFYLSKTNKFEFFNSLFFDIFLGAICFIVSILLFFFTENYFEYDLDNYLVLFLITRILQYSEETFKGYLISFSEFNKLALLNFFTILIRFVALYLILIKNSTISGYFFAVSLSTTVSFFIGLFYCRQYLFLEKISFKTFKTYISEIKETYFKQRFDQVAGIIPNHFDILILSIFGTFTEVGLFRIARRLVEPINGIINSLTPIIQNKISDKNSTFSQNEFVFKILLPISSVLLIFYSLIGENLIILVTSKEFKDAYLPLLIVLLSSLIYLNTFWVRYILLFNNFIHLHALARIFGAVAFLISGIFLADRYFAIGISLALLLGNFIQKIYELFVYKKYIKS